MQVSHLSERWCSLGCGFFVINLIYYYTLFYFIHAEIYTEVISFVSLIGRTMYFHSRLPTILKISRSERKHLSTYEIKTSHHGKCLDNFYSLVVMHQKTHSFAALIRSFF